MLMYYVQAFFSSAVCETILSDTSFLIGNSSSNFREMVHKNHYNYGGWGCLEKFNSNPCQALPGQFSCFPVV